jgi:hypothetical protein
MKKAIVIFFYLLMLNICGFSQQHNGNTAPRPPSCKTENSCPRNTLFHETTFRFDKLGLNWNSINWDHILICRERYLVSFRIGIDYYSFLKIHSAGVPIDINLMIGGEGLMFEAGLGLNYLYVYGNYNDSTDTRFKDKLSYLAVAGRLGLRYQKESSIFFRLGYTPMYSLMGDQQIGITNRKGIPIIQNKKLYSMFSIGIGYTF